MAINLQKTKPQHFYYEWGNEKRGYVSTYHVENGLVKHGPQIPKSEAFRLGYLFDCPYS